MFVINIENLKTQNAMYFLKRSFYCLQPILNILIQIKLKWMKRCKKYSDLLYGICDRQRFKLLKY